ncbi:MAG: 4'-phosphopantetheinyl transferase superfamily protein [Jatrophihabitantaceae bacterium]
MNTDVAIWLIRIGQPADVIAELTELLDEDERARAAQLSEPAERASFIVAHGAQRQIVAGQLGVPATTLRWRQGRHGKPELAEPAIEIRCNLSHSEELAAVALTSRRPIGIDIQRRQIGFDLGRMAERYYPADEARFVAAGRTERQRAVRFTGLWTRKEACIKAEGGRLVAGLRRPARAAGPTIGTVLVADPATPSRPYLVRDLIAPPGFHAAVAVGGSASFTVARRWWAPRSEPARSDGS